MTRLYRVKTGATNVFARKESRRNKKYNVILVVDESGSMLNAAADESVWYDDYYTKGMSNEQIRKKYGTRIDVAAECTTFLAQALQGAHVNVGVVGFNTYIKERKTMDQHFKPAKFKTLHSLLRGGVNYGGGDNNDSDALHFAYEKLKNREGTSIVIFMSDGAPAHTSWSQEMIDNPRSYKDELGEYSMYLHDHDMRAGYERNDSGVMHKMVAKHKDIHTIGFGINSDCDQIPGATRIDNLEELKPRIIHELKKIIKRG